MLSDAGSIPAASTNTILIFKIIPIKIPGAMSAGKYVIPVSALEGMSDKF